MKERLTGAIILVAVLVLLVPELLTGPSRSAQAARSAANADGAQMRSYTINLADDAATRPPASASTDAPGAESPAPAQRPAESAASLPDTQADAGSAGTAQVESADAPPRAGVEDADETEQSSDARASSRAPQPLPPAPVARAETPKAAVARVEQPAPARAESRLEKGWAIQVGSFASRDNAERLARNLKGKGFAATVSESSGKGKRLWRVRVGPEADRAGAVALGVRLRSAGQSGGAVVPYP